MIAAPLARAEPGGIGHGEAPAVRRLTLKDFRNYARLELDLGPGPVVLVGENGAGKTNLLEAVSLLAPGRGLRARPPVRARPRGGGPLAAGGARRRPLGPHRPRERARRGRRAAAGRVPRRAPAQPERARRHAEPGLADAGDGPPVPRGGLGPAALPRPARARDRPAPRRPRLDLRAPPARALAPAAPRPPRRGLAPGAGAQDRRGRRGDRGRAQRAGARPEGGAGQVSDVFPRPRLALEGEVEGWLPGVPALEAEERFALAARRHPRAPTPRPAGPPSGPHRSDLAVADDRSRRAGRALLHRPPEGAADQHRPGRRRALRRRRCGDLPVLLLDEVAAHLDPAPPRRAAREPGGLGAQCWLTGTDAALFAPLSGRCPDVSTSANGDACPAE